MNKDDAQQLRDQVRTLEDSLSRLRSDFRGHFHDGNNSRRINISDLFTGMKWGNATLVTGAVTITDHRIGPSSVMIVTPQSGFATAHSISAVYSAPNSFIIHDAQTGSYNVFYMIIF